MDTHEVAGEQLDKLRDMIAKGPLESDSDLHLCQLVATFVDNIKDGKVQGKIFTDGWPQFTCVAVAVTVPRISEVVDIYTHSTDHRKLMQLLREADLITWGKMQVINMGLIGNIDHALKLVTATKPPPDKPNLPGLDIVHHSRLMCITKDREETGMKKFQDRMSHISLPAMKSYSLGKLEPHQAEYIASYSYPTTSGIQTGLTDYISSQHLIQDYFVPYFEYLIKNFVSVAIYAKNDPSKPVAWILMKPNGHPGYQYVLKEHRQMGLGIILLYAFGSPSSSSVFTMTFNLKEYFFDKFGWQQVGDFVSVLHPGKRKNLIHLPNNL